MEIELRDWSGEDADWYVQQVQDPEILRFTIERKTLTTEEFRRALAGLRHNADALGFCVVDATSGARLANVAAARHGRVAEVSYWVAAAARGNGVASRALHDLCRRVVETWPVAEIRLWTHAENLASQRAAEKAGFSRLDGADSTKEVAGQHWPVRWYHRLV